MRMIRFVLRLYKIPFMLLLLAVALMAMCSCSTVKYVPVESVRIDSVRVTDIMHDSIHVHDSIYVHEKADTVYVTRWRTEYREALRVDTVHVVRTDSVQKVVAVPRELTRAQQLKMDVGGGVLWAMMIIVPVALFVLYRKFIK